jgi:nitroreductase
MQDNPVFSAITGRRSVRRYTSEPLSKEEIEDIVTAGRYAPSASNIQPWRFIVITNKERIRELSWEIQKAMSLMLKFSAFLKVFSKELRNPASIRGLKHYAENQEDVIFHDAPVLILVVSKKGPFNAESCACAVENMMLAAYSMGLGSCWIGFIRFLRRGSVALKKIDVPPKHRIVAAVVFGHPEQVRLVAPMRKIEAGMLKWVE